MTEQPRAPEAPPGPVPSPGATAHPARRTIATFTSYRDAEAAVDRLSDAGFPVGRTAIVGLDLRMVEQVIGRQGLGGAALRGAGSGALTGALIGWIFGLFDWLRPLVASLALAVYGLVFGAIVGALLGLLVHALQGGRRDFTAVSTLLPARYELEVDVEVAERAEAVLRDATGRHARDRYDEKTTIGKRED
jgi:hypothetical protein